MKTLTCITPEKFELADQPKPVCKSAEALVQVQRIGICGTDLHAFSGRQPFFTYPRILGHEIGGEIAEIGENDKGMTVGDRVAVIPYLHCGHCIACRNGRTNCCCDINVIGVHSDGGMREFINVPVDHLLKSPGLSMDQLAMVECFAIGAHAASRAKIVTGEKVLVVGAGPIGLGLVQMVQIAGANVIAMDIDADRLAFCQKVMGIEHTIQAGRDDPAEHLSHLTDGDYPLVIFDCTGNPQSMMDGFNYLGHGGRYVLVSLVMADIQFSDPEFHKRETTLLSSRNATKDDFLWVMRCMEDGRLKTDVMISHRCSFEQVPERFEKWSRAGSGVIKAMIEL